MPKRVSMAIELKATKAESFIRDRPAVDKDEIRRLLHCLWGKAVGTSDYDKREWLDLQEHVEDLLHGVRQSDA
jgi:hypothetical protein